MSVEVITPAQFARQLGVTGNAVYKAIRSGRLTAYDGDGKRVPPGFVGKKWLKPGLAAEDWHNRRQRINDDALAGASDLQAARARTANAQAELLEMRVAKERGELISRAAVMDNYHVLCLAIQRTFKNGPTEFAEELYGVALHGNGGLGLFASVLRTF